MTDGTFHSIVSILWGNGLDADPDLERSEEEMRFVFAILLASVLTFAASTFLHGFLPLIGVWLVLFLFSLGRINAYLDVGPSMATIHTSQGVFSANNPYAQRLVNEARAKEAAKLLKLAQEYEARAAKEREEALKRNREANFRSTPNNASDFSSYMGMGETHYAPPPEPEEQSRPRPKMDWKVHTPPPPSGAFSPFAEHMYKEFMKSRKGMPDSAIRKDAARMFHPDVNKAPQAEEVMKIINSRHPGKG